MIVRLLAVLSAFALVAAPVEARESSDLIIAGGHLVDGTGRPMRPDTVLYIRNGRIDRIGTLRRGHYPTGSNVVDARGKFIVPGLVDAHTHIDSPGGLPLSEEQKAITRAYAPRAFLYNGVTSVINMTAEEPDAVLALRDRARSTPSALLPRIFTGRAALTNPKGWGARYGGGVSDAGALERRIADDAGRGFDLVKLMIEDGLAAPVFPRIDPQFPALAVRLARQRHLRVFVHATDEDEYLEAIAARPQVLAHGLLTPQSPESRIFAGIRKRGILVVPTLVLFESFTRFRDDPGLLDDPILQASVPDFILALARDKDAMLAASTKMDGVLRLDAASWARRAVVDLKVNTRRMAQAGIPLAVGSDSGGAVVHAFQGYNTPREMELLAECCLTPMGTLVAATRRGAEAIGRSAEFGTIEKGKSADLLILNRNPLESIANVRDFDRLVLRGTLIERASLSFSNFRPADAGVAQ